MYVHRELRLVLSLCLTICLVTIPVGVSKAEYPERPISLIVHTTPGGGTDASARALAKNYEKILGQPVIVVNKPGAGGAAAVDFLARSKPDGYTVGLTATTPLVQTPQMFDVTFDPMKDFDFIGVYGEFGFGHGVKADSSFKIHQDLVNYAKANPGKLKYGVWALASAQTFGMMSIAKADGIRWEVIAFKGGSEAMTALLGGHVDLFVQVADIAVPQMRAGTARLLASWGDKRWKWAPDVPTMKDLGYDFTLRSYLALGAPKGVPKPVLDKLRDVFKQIMNDTEFAQMMESFYVIPVYKSPEEYLKITENDFNFYNKFLKEVGLHKSQKK